MLLSFFSFVVMVHSWNCPCRQCILNSYNFLVDHHVTGTAIFIFFFCILQSCLHDCFLAWAVFHHVVIDCLRQNISRTTFGDVVTDNFMSTYSPCFSNRLYLGLVLVLKIWKYDCPESVFTLRNIMWQLPENPKNTQFNERKGFFLFNRPHFQAREQKDLDCLPCPCSKIVRMFCEFCWIFKMLGAIAGLVNKIELTCNWLKTTERSKESIHF